MTYDEYRRELGAKRLKDEVNAGFSNKKVDPWVIDVESAAKRAEIALNAVKSAESAVKALNDAELARRNRFFGSDKPTVSTHNPNKSFLYHKLEKKWKPKDLDIPDDDEDLL